MTLPYLALKSTICTWINDQLDVLRTSKLLTLNNFPCTELITKLQLAEIIECIHEFLYSYDPPIQVETISFANKQIDELPENISIIGHNVKYLDAHANNLTKLPKSLREFKRLEILDISSNKLWYISDTTLSNLTNLRVLSIKENRFKYLSPVIGDFANLNLIEIEDNPLILPSQDLIISFQKQRSDWVEDLKGYLQANRSILIQKISELSELSRGKQDSSSPDEVNVTFPQTVTRSRSTSDARSSRASRRMGLIIKKNDRSTTNDADISEEMESNSSFITANDSTSSGITDTFEQTHTHSILDPNHHQETPSTLSISLPVSHTVSPNTIPSSTQHSKLPNFESFSNPNSRVPRPIPARQRSNTLKDIDKFLEKNEVDTENKSSAYFRRLSTLQELAADESSNQQENLFDQTLGISKTSARHLYGPDVDTIKLTGSLIQNLKQEEVAKASPSISRTAPVSIQENSPSKTQLAKRYNPIAIIKVSRKVLFAFSELHSSVRRFSGFCGDKKVRYKMVSYLYTTKANVDTLVENLEIMEDNINNLDLIVTSLHACITSFKAMMSLLTDNFQIFVTNIDLCFIRMLFLTIYGSMNELYNAYRILVPHSKPAPPQFGVTNTNGHTNDHIKQQKLLINTNSETDEVDENLYRAIDVATTNAKDVFSELTRAIGTSAIASTSNDTSTKISPTVARHVKELTSICMGSMEITKNLKTKLVTIRNNPSMATKRGFWDDINSFLKAIIQTFQSVKGIMQDLPILNEIRGSMSTLTKNTKDLTVLLEVSSYKSMSNETNGNVIPTPQGSGLVSGLNLSQLSTQPVRTPLVATLGAAAQAIMPNINSAIEPSHSGFNSVLDSSVMGSGAATVPINSSGQYFVKNGINPFDGLIVKNREEKLREEK